MFQIFSHPLQRSLEHPIIFIIPRRTVHGKLNRLKLIPVFLHHSLHRCRNDSRRITECSTAKSSEDYDFIPFCSRDIQHFPHSFFMQSFQLCLTDPHWFVTIPGVHSIAWTSPKVRRCACQNIYRVPLLFR